MPIQSRLTSVVFRLTKERLEALKALSRGTRIRQSEYLREAIGDLLTKYAVPAEVPAPSDQHH
jgi:predicted DNA-binding protein